VELKWTYGMDSVLSPMPRLIMYTKKKYKTRNNPTLAMAEVITSGMGSVISPMPKLIVDVWSGLGQEWVRPG
jgi:hypothetical protein